MEFFLVYEKIIAPMNKTDEHSVSSVQSLSRVWLFATPWIAARQASLSITNSRSSQRLTSIESVMPFRHLILCRPLLLLPPVPPSIRVFSNESTLCMRWPQYWSFSFSIIPSKEIPGLISFRMDWLDLLAVPTPNSHDSEMWPTKHGSCNKLWCYLRAGIYVLNTEIWKESSKFTVDTIC